MATVKGRNRQKRKRQRSLCKQERKKDVKGGKKEKRKKNEIDPSMQGGNEARKRNARKSQEEITWS